jgi:hypothetical protein
MIRVETRSVKVGASRDLKRERNEFQRAEEARVRREIPLLKVGRRCPASTISLPKEEETGVGVGVLLELRSSNSS